MITTYPEDMHPRLATLMETIRGVLQVSCMADNNRTPADHHQVVITALPCITGNVDVLFHDDLIQTVFQQEGIK